MRSKRGILQSNELLTSCLYTQSVDDNLVIGLCVSDITGDQRKAWYSTLFMNIELIV